MKLNLKIHKASPRVEKINFNSELVELFDSYLKFYQRELGAEITAEQAIIKMLINFIKSDRDFMRWYKQQADNKVSS